MGSKELVTVIIPCYNYGQFLGDAIDSVLQQSHKVFEIIVVDDGSTDNTEELATRYAELHSNVVYYHQKNQGLSAARNAGIRMSHGEYILFLDADDMIKKSFLTKCLQELHKNSSASFAYTQMEYFGRENKTSQFPKFDLDALKSNNFINASALFRRIAFNHVLYDPRLRRGLEDWDVYLGLAERGMYGALLDESLLLYRKHEAGVESMTDRMQKQSTFLHTKLRIQLKHIRLIGLSNLLKTLSQYKNFKISQAKSFLKRKTGYRR